jgi:uroporphyrin-III C-methyltransferase/precorrin-2 dehydrogenase/sirohydrochlorin ferrochelatase
VAGAEPSGWEKAVAAADTAVLYMAAAEAEAVKEALLGQGMSATTPVAIAENVSLDSSSMRRGNLAALPDLAAALEGGAALVLIGEVFAAREAQRNLPSTSGKLTSAAAPAFGLRSASQSA